MTSVVFLHGFTQTGGSGNDLLGLIAATVGPLDAATPDLPGHGDADQVRGLDLWEVAEWVAERIGPAPATVIGYSQGGRVALHLALHSPNLVDRLVLIGATAGIDNDAERVDRRRRDDDLANRIESIGVPAFIDEWLAQPLFRTLPDDSADRARRLTNSAPGLASALRSYGTGTQAPLWTRLEEITCLTLVLAGERDEKFTALGRRLASAMPNGRFETIASAGHAAHSEQPAETATVIARFLQS
jgi:2-succinyl-6-hydroxy-2,4-cyclohexadiene-1-carboxylate synthase